MKLSELKKYINKELNFSILDQGKHHLKENTSIDPNSTFIEIIDLKCGGQLFITVSFLAKDGSELQSSEFVINPTANTKLSELISYAKYNVKQLIESY